MIIQEKADNLSDNRRRMAVVRDSDENYYVYAVALYDPPKLS